jgi:hypothetical protein
MKIKKKLAFLLFFSSTAIFSQTLQQAIKETDNELYSTAEKNIKFLITNGLGHNKIYKTPEIVDQIVAFLGS